MATIPLTGTNGETLIGSEGNDVFTLTVQTDLDPTDKVLGQGGSDTLQVATGLGTIQDNRFAGVSSVETLTFKGDSSVSVDVGINFVEAGFKHIDAHGIGSGVGIDASGIATVGLAIDGGIVQNEIFGTQQNDVIRLAAGTLSTDDEIDGGGHVVRSLTPDLDNRLGDALELYSDAKSLFVVDSQFATIANIQTLSLSGKAGFDVTLGDKAALAGIKTVDASASTGAVKIDVSALTGMTVNFTSKGLTAADTVIGQTFETVLGITDKAAVLDAAFKGITNISTLAVFGDAATQDFAGAKITLGAVSQAKGLFDVFNLSDYALTVDASARTGNVQVTGGIGNDVLIASKNTNDSFDGQGGDDSLRITLAAFDSNNFDGGTGTDEVRILDSSTSNAVVVADTDFFLSSSVERLAFDGTGAQIVSLGDIAEAAGLTEVDGSKVAGGLNIDAAGMNDTALKVIAGTGIDDVVFGGGNIGAGVSGDLLITTKAFTFADSFVAASGEAVLHFTDAVKLADAYFAPLASSGSLVGFDTLDLDNGAAKQSLAAGANLATFLDNSGITAITATSGDAKSSFTFDFSKFSGLNSNDLIVTGGAGNDLFIGSVDDHVSLIGGAGDDVFKFSSALFSVPALEGGDGKDTLVLTDGGSFSDSAFQRFHDVEVLQLAAAKAAFGVNLSSNGHNSGIRTFDASLAGVDVTITATIGDNLTLIGGSKTNILTAANGADTLKIAAGTFNTGDVLDGGGGGGTNTLQFITGGAVGKGGVFHNISLFQLSDAGNVFKLEDLDLNISSFGKSVTFDFADQSLAGFTAIVHDGKGNDTVDFDPGQSLGGVFGFTSSGGNDTFIGAVGGENVYAFAEGTLNASDKVIGNTFSTSESVLVEAGSYTSDQFKGFKNVDQLFATGGATTVILKNDFFNTLDFGPFSFGVKNFLIGNLTPSSDDRLDASAVTNALNSVTFSGGGGDDTLIGGAGRDEFSFQNPIALDAQDHIEGRGGVDKITLIVDGTDSLDDADLADVSSVEQIFAAGGGALTLNLGLNAVRAGIDTVTQDGVDLTVAAKATAPNGNFLEGLTVNLGDGDVDLKLGAGVDTVVLVDNGHLDSNDTIDGGGGNAFGKIDRIVFQGSAAIDDSQFANVKNIPVVALAGAANKITLGANADAKDILRVDASQAAASVIVDASAMKDSLTITGSHDGDDLRGGAGSDVLYGGGQDGVLADKLDGGAGADTFVYRAASESMLLPSGNTNHVDVISNLDAADTFDFSAFKFVAGTGAVTDSVFTDVDTNNGFFGGNTVAVALNTDTFVYVDVDQNGEFNTGVDLFIQVKGDHKTDLLGITSYIFGGQGLDPGLPYLGNFADAAQPSVILMQTPATFDDAAIAALSPDGIIRFGDAKGTWNLTVGEGSEKQGLDAIDAGAASGKVTIDASDRFASILIGAGKGQNTLNGGNADDRFVFREASLDSKDAVSGGAGVDVLQVVGGTGKAGLLDAAFTNVKSVEVLNFGADPLVTPPTLDLTGQKVVLGKFSDAAGLDRVINSDTFGFGLTVDASARTDGIRFDGNAGGDVFIASQGVDFFDAGNGNDVMSFKLQALGANDTFLGGLGTDEVHILDSFDELKNKFQVDDSDFSRFYSVERLVFDGTGSQQVVLNSNADAMFLDTVDASKVAGVLFLNAGKMAGALTVIAGTGADTIILGGSDSQVLINSSKLNGSDSLSGQGFAELHFTDAVKLADKYFAGGTGTAVSGFNELHFANAAKGQSLTAADNFAAFIVNSGIETVSFDGTDPAVGFTFDFSKYVHTSGNPLTLVGGAGNDAFSLGASAITFSGGAGDDTFSVGSIQLNLQKIEGGDGNDTILVVDNTSGLGAGVFSGSKNVEILKFAAIKGGVGATLDTDADAAGIHIVDGSLVVGSLGIDAGNTSGGITFIASKTDVILTGGKGDDTFKFDAKTFTDQDLVTGGSEIFAADILAFSTSGTIAASAFANTTGIEELDLSDKGNNVTLSDHLIAGSAGGQTTHALDGVFDFIVYGGLGNDTVDLSQLTDFSKSVAVQSQGGKDTMIGSGGNDHFLFTTKAGGFNSADVVRGGGGYDTLWISPGTYTADSFKGLTSIEQINVNDVVGTSSNSLFLNNDAFKGADLQDNGTRALTIDFIGGAAFGAVNASAVTNANDQLSVLFQNTDGVTFVGGAGADTVQFNDAGVALLLDPGDPVDGGLGRDTVVLAGTVAESLSDLAFGGLHSIERLVLANPFGSMSFGLADNALAAGIVEVDASQVVNDLLVDASGYGAVGLAVTAGQGKSQVQLAAGDDTVRFLNGSLDSSDSVSGQDGQNTIELVGDATETNASFASISKFQTLKLIEGTFDITFDNNTNDFVTVDGSAAGHGMVFKATAGFTAGIAVIGSDFADTIQTSSSANTINGRGGGDTFVSVAAADTFVYQAAADSKLGAGDDFTNVDKILGFSDFDTIDLSDVVNGGTVNNLGTGFNFATARGAFEALGFQTDAVILFSDGTDSYIFADANHDSAFNINSDLVIKIVGISNTATLATQIVTI